MGNYGIKAIKFEMIFARLQIKYSFRRKNQNIIWILINYINNFVGKFPFFFCQSVFSIIEITGMHMSKRNDN